MSVKPENVAPRQRRTGLVLVAFVIVALIGLGFWGSDRTTQRYWNEVHELARQADALKHLDTPEEVIAALGDLEQSLAALSTQGVDPRAIEAANRLRAALVVARDCVEQGQWMLDHPIRTTLRAGVDLLRGHGLFQKLREQLLHLREVTVGAHEFSLEVHGQLARRYPLSRFEHPIPPDVHLFDEALRELEQMDREGQEAVDLAYQFGVLLGAVAALLFGG